MAKIVKSSVLGKVGRGAGDHFDLWVYNGMDCMLTYDLFERLQFVRADEDVETSYEHAKRMQYVVLDTMRQGMYVDLEEKQRVYDRLKAEHLALSGIDKNEKGSYVVVDEGAVLQRLAIAAWGKPLNYRSPVQLKKFIYDEMGTPIFRQRRGKKWVVGTGHEVLNKIKDRHPSMRLFCELFMYLAELDNGLNVLGKALDADGRWRSSLSIAGTETGRFSSSKSAFNTGDNAQNIKKTWRVVIKSEKPGYVIWNADFEQAESRIVAYESGDEAYIEAVNSGDLHTMVASMVFGIPNKREEADRVYYRDYTYRDMSKRAGHGLNYMLQPRSLASDMKIELAVAEEIYEQYFKAFPGILDWHGRVAKQLETEGWLRNCLGFKRWFWDRPTDSGTLREAVAFVPQSTIPSLLNRGWLRMYENEMLRECGVVPVLNQVHDSLVGHMPEKMVDKLAPIVLDCLEIPLTINGRQTVIPASIEVGPNWKDLTRLKVER